MRSPRRDLGKRYMEYRASLRRVVRIDSAAVRRQDALNDAESKPEASGFGGDEWLEQATRQLRRYAGTGVAHQDVDGACDHRGFDHHASLSGRRLGHRVERVEHQV